MTSYPITHTTPNDLPFIYSLFEAAILYQKKKNYPVWKGYDKAVLKDDIANKRQYKIMIDDQIAGVFSICFSDEIVWRTLDVGDAIYLHRIVVNPKFKGRKLFGHILSWAQAYIKANKLQKIRLDTWGDNPNIIHYYQSFGFKIIEYFNTPDSEELPIQQRGNYVVLMEF